MWTSGIKAGSDHIHSVSCSLYLRYSCSWLFAIGVPVGVEDNIDTASWKQSSCCSFSSCTTIAFLFTRTVSTSGDQLQYDRQVASNWWTTQVSHGHILFFFFFSFFSFYTLLGRIRTELVQALGIAQKHVHRCLYAQVCSTRQHRLICLALFAGPVPPPPLSLSLFLSLQTEMKCTLLAFKLNKYCWLFSRLSNHWTDELNH